MKRPGSTARDRLHIALAGPAFREPLARFLTHDAGSDVPPTAGTPVWQLACDLSSSGHNVSLVTLDMETRRRTSLTAGQVRVVVGPYRPAHRMWDLMRTERRAVRESVSALAPDIVHAHWCYEYALGALAAGTPTLVTVRDWIPAILRHMDARYWPYWSGRALLYGATLARARHFTANSPYMAGKVRPFARGAVEVIPNGIPDTEFVDAGEIDADASGNAAVAFISVNNGFGPLKNVASLLMAFAALRSRLPNLELHLAGDGYAPDGDCRRWADTHSLSAGVTFLGRVPRTRLLESLSGYFALVHPSREESFGMTLVEAMARGVPVIGGARSGAVPWVVGGGSAGILVDVEDPRDIARAMEALVTDPELRTELRTAGLAHARRHFAQSRVTALYLDAYKRVLADEHRRN